MKNYYPVSFFGEDISVFAVDGLKVGSGGKVKVSGGRVVIFVKGDVIMEGGPSISIDMDSSLTLIVTGNFNLTGGVTFTNKNVINNNGEALFTLLSTNTNSNAVSLSGGTKVYGLVYSLSNLELSGSGSIAGQAYGANINAKGGTAIDFTPNPNSGGVNSKLDPNIEFD